MTRDELKAWRKEARRVRNRESAAASRKRNRERIDELESEVDALKTKYAAALSMAIATRPAMKNLNAETVNGGACVTMIRACWIRVGRSSRSYSDGMRRLKT